MTRYDPMDVTIERDPDHPRTFGPNPPCDPNWPLIDRLRHRAGMIRAKTGVVVRFDDGAECSGPGYHDVFPRIVGVQVGVGDFWTSSVERPGPLLDAFLDGVQAGARAVALGATDAAS